MGPDRILGLLVSSDHYLFHTSESETEVWSWHYGICLKLQSGLESSLSFSEGTDNNSMWVTNLTLRPLTHYSACRIYSIPNKYSVRSRNIPFWHSGQPSVTFLLKGLLSRESCGFDRNRSPHIYLDFVVRKSNFEGGFMMWIRIQNDFPYLKWCIYFLKIYLYARYI